MDQFDFLIVGSGPSACGALKALHGKEKKVCVIDIGLLIDRNGIDFHNYNENIYHYHDLNSKTLFGNRSPRSGLNQDINGTEVGSSEMLGGYSNLWGAVCERLGRIELLELGIHVQDVNKFYDDVSDLIPNQKRAPKTASIYVSNSMLKQAKGGVWTWPSLACDFDTCIGCRKCFYGCPNGSIHDVRSAFSHLSKEVKYINGAVYSFEESEDAVIVNYIEVETAERKCIRTNRVLLGAGPIESSKIITRSVSKCTSFELQDNSYNIFPLITLYRGTASNTLCELVAYKYTANAMTKAQFYTGSPYIANQIIKSYFQIFRSSKLLNSILQHIGLLQVFVDGRNSPRVIIDYDRSACKFYASAIGKRMSIVKIFNAYLKEVFNLKAILLPLCKKAPVLSGMHFGAVCFNVGGEKVTPNHKDGSLDMIKNIHLIDASAFKNVPAISPTETIVANAFRITTEILS